jgi:hypothetical protein
VVEKSAPRRKCLLTVAAGSKNHEPRATPLSARSNQAHGGRAAAAAAGEVRPALPDARVACGRAPARVRRRERAHAVVVREAEGRVGDAARPRPERVVERQQVVADGLTLLHVRVFGAAGVVVDEAGALGRLSGAAVERVDAVPLRLDVEQRASALDSHARRARALGRVLVEAVVGQRLDVDDAREREVVAPFGGDDEGALHVVLVREDGRAGEARRVVAAAASRALAHGPAEERAGAPALVVARVEDGVVDEEVRRRLADGVIDVGEELVARV